jgi:hypothetical protein
MTYGSKGEERARCVFARLSHTHHGRRSSSLAQRANAQQLTSEWWLCVYFGRNFHMEIKHVPPGHVPAASAARRAKEESVMVIKGAMRCSLSLSLSLSPARRGQDGCPSWPHLARREKNSRRPPPYRNWARAHSILAGARY